MAHSIADNKESEKSYPVNINTKECAVATSQMLNITVGGVKLSAESVVINPIEPDSIVTATIVVPVTFCV